MKTQKTKKVCMVPGCGRAPRARGLCSSCYTTAMRLICERRTTWSKLEASEKCSASNRTLGVAAYFIGK